MDDDQQFCLRWNNHQSTLVAVFDTLLESEKLVDCTLAAEGKFLNAHKVVLSACSPYFEALLSRHHDKHPILILKDVKFQELKAMMDYMYRGEVNISQDQLGALLKAAESLQIKGLSDNKKDEPPAKRPAPAPATPKSPQPQTQLPKVQGLTIEQRSRDEREGSMSPGPRKKKRMRRKSEEMDNHHDASNSSDAHSLPPQHIPSATTQLPANIKMNSSDVPDTIETKQEILTRHKDETGSQHQSQVPMIKEKLETHTELMLEPKSEYVEEMNEDSIEDLTLDDDDLSNMEQMDDGAGPSHGGEGSSQQGFGHWQMGNQSQDEVFLAAQEAVGAHRDSQGYRRYDQKFTRRQPYNQPHIERRAPPAPTYDHPNRNIEILGTRRNQNVPQKIAAMKRKVPQPVKPGPQFNYPKNPKTVVVPSRRALDLKTAPQRDYSKTSQNTLVPKKQDLDVSVPSRLDHSKAFENMMISQRQDLEVKAASQQDYSKAQQNTIVQKRQAVDVKAQSQPDYSKTIQDMVVPKRKVIDINVSSNIDYPKVSPNVPKIPGRSQAQESTETRPVFNMPTPSPRKGPGLLTDSLSCIFTRRKSLVPQRREFYEDEPRDTASDVQREEEDKLSDTESTYLPSEKQPVFSSPPKDCPAPPRISQPTPDLKTEDWFTLKQRILGNVTHEATQNICEPVKVATAKCPEPPPPRMQVDPHGFDIEPPTHLNKNVSPYVPSNSYERDEYEKYKSEKLKKEVNFALLQERYEAVKQAQEIKKQIKEAKVSQQQNPTYEITVTSSNYSDNQAGYEEAAGTYTSTDQYDTEQGDQDMEKYRVDKENYDVPVSNIQHQYNYQEPSYKPTALQEQTTQYENIPSTYQSESRNYYDDHYGTYGHHDQENQANQQMYAQQQNYENIPAEADASGETNICPQAPQISPMVHETEGQDNKAPQNYQEVQYQEYTKYDETNTFKEPLAQPVKTCSQTMCHKCSFQTTNPKKLRDHLKFVHGEQVPGDNTPPASKASELFSRREPKVPENQEYTTQGGEKKKPIEVRFKRRNTSALVNIISSDIIVPAMTKVETKGEEEPNLTTSETGVSAALEYYETTKDQPKKPRPYRRDTDKLDNEWI